MAATGVYRPRSVKKRRTRQELNEILQASQRIISGENGRVTIRHLYYRLVSEGLLEKTEREYKNLGDHLMKWRRSGEIPWSAFADNTRWYRGDVGFSNVDAALISTRDAYRRNLWATQRVFVEIWTEKDAIASILVEEANTFGVQVFPLRGFSSGTALYNAADHFKEQQAAGKEVFVYYFGDHDPSGVEIDKSTIKNLKNDHGVEINFERVAVLPEHIDQYNLLTRPSKKSDSRSINFEGESVEIDAMPMAIIREMVSECITAHINLHEWAMQKRIEFQERQLLNQVVFAIGQGAV